MLKGVHKSYGAKTIYDGLDFHVRRKERWCIMGVNGAGKSTLLKLIAGATRARCRVRSRSAPASRWAISPSTPWTCSMATPRSSSRWKEFPQAGQGSLRALAGCFGFSGDDVEKKCRVLSGGEKARLVMADAVRSAELPRARRADQPPGYRDQGDADHGAGQYEGTMLFVSHDRHFLAALSNRVLELTPEGVHPMAAATPNMSPAPARRRRG
jgi:ATPase subunit of ABC transporter with duplicated ATPase domains